MRTKAVPSERHVVQPHPEQQQPPSGHNEELIFDESNDEPTENADQTMDDLANDKRPATALTWIVPSEPQNKTPFSVPALVRCRFGACEETFTSPFAFRSHFTRFHFPGPGCNAEGPCGVVGCHFTYDDINAYRRHLTFHIYHADLQWRGAEVLGKSGGQCKHVSEDATNVFYNGDPLQCAWDNCGRTFDDVADFFGHVSYHGKSLNGEQESEKEQKFLCLWADCKYGSKRKYEVAAHLRHHTGEKMVSCPACGAFFANSTKLVDHCSRQISTESSRLKCMLCNKIFSSERLLRDHGRRHINHYKCPFCELSLPTPSTLRWHVMHRHTETTPHVCLTCSKGFKTALDLERHFAKHSDSSEHECRVCGRKFKWLQSMQTHERQHYQIELTPYLCHLCPKKYRQGSFLSHHFISAHKVSLPPGHSRFTYKKCADGYYRLMTERYESARIQHTADEEDQMSEQL